MRQQTPNTPQTFSLAGTVSSLHPTFGSRSSGRILRTKFLSISQHHSILHNLTIAFSPWLNGTVDSVTRSVLSATRAMLAELKLAPQDWDSVLTTISSALNEASPDRFGYPSDRIYHSPLNGMTGIDPKHQFVRVIPVGINQVRSKTMEHAPPHKSSRSATFRQPSPRCTGMSSDFSPSAARKLSPSITSLQTSYPLFELG